MSEDKLDLDAIEALCRECNRPDVSLNYKESCAGRVVGAVPALVVELRAARGLLQRVEQENSEGNFPLSADLVFAVEWFNSTAVREAP